MEAQKAHRSGIFKQPHKAHKSGPHRTKGELSRISKGKRQARKGSGGKISWNQSRRDRMNERKQKKDKKLATLAKRLELEGGSNKAPQFITVLSLDPDLSASCVVERLITADEAAHVDRSEFGSFTFLSVPKFKSRFCFAVPNPSKSSLNSLLECLSVSDILMLAWPKDGKVDENQKIILDVILSSSAIPMMHLVSGIPSNGKQREHYRKTVTKSIDSWITSTNGISFFDGITDYVQILRQLPTIRKISAQPKRRTHFAVEKYCFSDVENGVGTLRLNGYIRGSPLNVNHLVYIKGWGPFQLKQIELISDPRSLNRAAKECTVLTPDPSKQETLQSEIIPDPMDAEQPNIDEDLNDDAKFKKPTLKRKVPKGMSDYQAAWIVDSDDESDEEDVDDNEEDMEMEECSQEEDAMSVRSTMDTMTEGDFEDEPIDENDLQSFRDQMETMKYPDYVDTPVDRTARERFQRYRGLKSFRTSPWDVNENLPSDYGRIFKFANFAVTKKKVLREAEEDFSTDRSNEVAMLGSYVTLCVANVPSHITESWTKNPPIVIHGMLKHEQKFSLMNVVLKRHPSSKIPIKNKQPLVFRVGYQTFEVNALFSQHSNGSRFKMERFMPQDGLFVASYYGPVVFGPCPVLVFRRDTNGRLHLVASGSVANAQPDRIVLKRVVLSGKIYKMNKRACVVRYMFFDKGDIEWFKPVELYTDSGNRGHIKASLGTHGHFKCTFNLPLKKQEHIKMNLFKRSFPKWTYVPYAAVEYGENDTMIEPQLPDVSMQE